MNKQEMIEVIYEKVANKERTFGCNIFYYTDNGHLTQRGKLLEEGILYDKDEFEDYKKYKINRGNGDIIYIGHPVMIGDVLDCILEFKESFEKIDMHKRWILLNWKKLRKPIEEQSEECIKYIYSLVK